MEFDAKAKTYSIWKAMNKRCRSQSSYMTKGIQVCSQWQSTHRKCQAFSTFVSDMGLCPSPEHSIDRVDNDGDYCPENCRWVTAKIQNNNKADNRYIEYAGKTQTMSQWADEVGLSYYVLRARLNLGWDFDLALNTPVGGKPPEASKYMFDGELMTVVQVSQKSGVPEPTIRGRLLKGESIEKAVSSNRERKNARNITAFGRTQTMTEWAEETGINQNTLRSRILYAKMDPETALTTKTPSR